MNRTKKPKFFPFNAEQTINILSEFGPLVTMFVVNAMYGINSGTWALMVTTGIAIAVMFYMFHRPPIFPLIASTVTIVFGALTLITGDPMWVQIKVTIFNAMFAGVLFGGLYGGERPGHHLSLWAVIAISLLGIAATYGDLVMTNQLGALSTALTTHSLTDIFKQLPAIIPILALLVGFLFGAALLKRNFFKYVFEKTFHYTEEGWDRFTWSFALFFLLTAVANEYVRLTYKEDHLYTFFGHQMNGVNVWILFKIAIVLPVTGVYAWLMTRMLHKYRLPQAAE